MGKILDYSQLSIPAAGDLLFIGDLSSNASNPEIKYITHDDLFKRQSISALDANGLSLYDDGSNLGIFIKDGGNIGIGNSTASATLHISKSGADCIIKVDSSDDGYDAYIDFVQNSASKFNIGFDDTNDSLLITRSITANNDIIIHSNGNVGIGTTSNNATLNVNDNINIQSTNDLIIDASNSEIKVDGAKLKINEYGGGTSGSPQTNDVEIYGQGGSFPLFFADTSAGNIGIGTNGPAAKLHVYSTAANLLLVHHNGATQDPYIEIRGANGDASATTYIVNTQNIAGIGGTSTLGTTTLNIQKTNGYVNIGSGTSAFDAKLSVTSSDKLASEINSDSTSGTILTLKNKSATTNVPTIAIVYSNKSTTQKINWIAGNFYNSASYFGIHYKTDNFTSTNAAFESTLANNLFYLDTSGNLNIKGNYKSNATSGHTTGRFVQSFMNRFYISDGEGEDLFLGGGLGNPTGNASTTVVAGINYDTDPSDIITAIGNPAPYSGKLIKVKIYGSDQTELSLSNQVRVFFRAITPASISTPISLNTSNSAYATTSVDALEIMAVSTFEVGDFTNPAQLEFSEDDILFVGIQRLDNSGHETLVANVVLTYEFDID